MTENTQSRSDSQTTLRNRRLAVIVISVCSAVAVVGACNRAADTAQTDQSYVSAAEPAAPPADAAAADPAAAPTADGAAPAAAPAEATAPAASPGMNEVAIAEFPDYPGATRVKVGSNMNAMNSARTTQIDYPTADSVDKVKAYYADLIRRGGWTVIRAKNEADGADWKLQKGNVFAEVEIDKDWNQPVEIEVELTKP